MQHYCWHTEKISAIDEDQDTFFGRQVRIAPLSAPTFPLRQSSSLYGWTAILASRKSRHFPREGGIGGMLGGGGGTDRTNTKKAACVVPLTKSCRFSWGNAPRRGPATRRAFSLCGNYCDHGGTPILRRVWHFSAAFPRHYHFSFVHGLFPVPSSCPVPCWVSSRTAAAQAATAAPNQARQHQSAQKSQDWAYSAPEMSPSLGRNRA